MTTLTAALAGEDLATLPPYVVANDQTCPSTLRMPAAPVSIPFSAQDLIDIDTLSRKFDAEVKCAGLAAVQIGISKRIIVFAAPNDPELKKWRPDLTDTMDKTIWINPEFTGIEEAGFHEDYEGCFSVEGVAGLVNRYKKINYTAYTSDGTYITGTVEGFLARLIQHEIDHLNGVLFTDIATKILPIEEYRAIRKQAEALGRQ